ncbi:PREDICTED: uncharacterized protein LOC109326317 [Lupinus angustifolius]|uniref:uncharacterized protein LOC109326317 n=1 Tax=Lupinus angustifolius TaxID=3871 RepID=UPI00092E5F3C|nr:PREDICTED: uncharacterized protein LOC109326317 [Lupinus angustifolius]
MKVRDRTCHPSLLSENTFYNSSRQLAVDIDASFSMSIGIDDNLIAELMALLHGLKVARSLGINNLVCISDWKDSLSLVMRSLTWYHELIDHEPVGEHTKKKRMNQHKRFKSQKEDGNLKWECRELVLNGVQQLGENPTEAHKLEFREAIKKDCKAIFLIHQCVDHSNFDKFSAAETSKEACETLEKCYGGSTKVRKVKLQMMRRQFELLQMEEDERISYYFARIRSLINLMRGCGEQMNELSIVDKILRTLSTKFDIVVIAIEESKDLETIKIDELQGSLEAHEQRLMERQNGRLTQQALSAQFKKKCMSYHDAKKKESDEVQAEKREGTEPSSSKQSDIKSSRKWNNQNSYQNNAKKKKNKSKIQCFNCKNYGHYASECKSKRVHKVEEARLSKDENSDEEVLLMSQNEITELMLNDGVEAQMVTTKDDADNWYLDTGCSNHMTGHRDWFIQLDDSVRTRVKFVDDSFITAEGMGKIVIKRKDGIKAYISNVLYVPKMKNNLISLGQLLEKGYNICMKDRMLKIYNEEGNLILKAPLSQNKTFKIGIQLANHKCLKSIADETWV